MFDWLRGSGVAVMVSALCLPGPAIAGGQAASGTAACPADLAEGVVVSKIGDFSPDPRAELPPGFGWDVSGEAKGTLRPNNSFEATGPRAAEISGFVLGRVFFGSCDYALSQTSSGYRLNDGRETPPGAKDGDGRTVNVLGPRETRSGRPVEVRLRQGRKSELLVCGTGGSCRQLATISRPVEAIRYLKSPDSLSGTLGVVERSEKGGRLLVNVDLDASRYR